VPFDLEHVYLGAVKVIVPSIFGDHRGWFMESYRKDNFEELGIPYEFKQDNHSRSVQGVLRGLHYQWDEPMGKLMRVTIGTVFMVAVDIRPGSPTVGKWAGIEVSAENRRQVWAPPSFARGFLVLSDVAELQYKCTAIYNKHAEGSIRWNDPEIGIDWPLKQPLLSDKDAEAQFLQDWLKSESSQTFHYQG
jgi:dTDP-4-dehydrorhamnose 3,5-epimerase